MFSNDPAEFERQNTQAMTDAENRRKRERFEPPGEWDIVEYWRTGYHEARDEAAKYRLALAYFYVKCGSSQEPDVVDALRWAKDALGIK